MRFRTEYRLKSDGSLVSSDFDVCDSLSELKKKINRRMNEYQKIDKHIYGRARKQNAFVYQLEGYQLILVSKRVYVNGVRRWRNV